MLNSKEGNARMSEKHIAYFTLVDALSEKGCPVCRVTEKSTAQYFDSLLYGGVNKVSFRKRVRKSGGFCSRHTEQLLSFRDGLSITLIHSGILEDVKEKLVPPRRKKRLFQSPEEEEIHECPACVSEKNTEKTQIRNIIQHQDDREFISCFQKSEGLCLPHYRLYLGQTKNPSDLIIAHQREQHEKLLHQMHQYISFCNVTNLDRPILKREEKLIYYRIVRYLHGIGISWQET